MGSFGDRMKGYEQSASMRLVSRMPAIIRIDGRAFHTLTRKFKRPYDVTLAAYMKETAIALCSEISTARFAYGQSDEISILLTDYDNFNTEQWFGGKVQKIVSVSASIATLEFRNAKPAVGTSGLIYDDLHKATFDSRVFNIPKEDVVNYFVFRQQDATRNSIQMVGQKYFSYKQLQNKSCDEIQEMLWSEYNINWNDFPNEQKRGWCVYRTPYKKTVDIPGKEPIIIDTTKWEVDENIPIFTQDRYFVDKRIELKDEKDFI